MAGPGEVSAVGTGSQIPTGVRQVAEMWEQAGNNAMGNEGTLGTRGHAPALPRELLLPLGNCGPEQWGTKGDSVTGSFSHNQKPGMFCGISQFSKQLENSLFKACASHTKPLRGLHLAPCYKLVTSASSKPHTILAPEGLGLRIGICEMVDSAEVRLYCHHSVGRLEIGLELGLGYSACGL